LQTHSISIKKIIIEWPLFSHSVQRWNLVHASEGRATGVKVSCAGENLEPGNGTKYWNKRSVWFDYIIISITWHLNTFEGRDVYRKMYALHCRIRATSYSLYGLDFKWLAFATWCCLRSKGIIASHWRPYKKQRKQRSCYSRFLKRRAQKRRNQAPHRSCASGPWMPSSISGLVTSITSRETAPKSILSFFPWKWTVQRDISFFSLGTLEIRKLSRTFHFSHLLLHIYRISETPTTVISKTQTLSMAISCAVLVDWKRLPLHTDCEPFFSGLLRNFYGS